MSRDSTSRALFFRSLLCTVFITSVFTSQNLKANLEGDSWIFHINNKNYSFHREGHIRGTPYICLPEITKKLGLKFEYNPRKFEFLLINTKTSNSLRARAYSKDVILNLKVKGKRNRMLTKLSRKPEFIKEKLCVPYEFGDRALRPLFDSTPPQTPLFVNDERRLSKISVVIDPGHGGNDHGAIHKSLKEENLTLQFSIDLQKSLTELGVKSLLTRDKSIFTTLSERARMANQSSAKLFISIHVNAQEKDGSLKGFELYILSLTSDDVEGRSAVAREHQMIPDDLPEGFEKAAADLRASANFESSLKWAEYLRGTLKSHIPPSSNKPIRMAPFYVLYAAQMPAILLELGYINQPEDMERILNPEKRKEIAADLAKKIAKKLQVSPPSP